MSLVMTNSPCTYYYRLAVISVWTHDSVYGLTFETSQLFIQKEDIA